jgi:hypothetical protein
MSDYPLSFQQQWLWALVERHSHWNRVCDYTLSLKGELNLQLLRRSVAEVVRRHSALRATIQVVDGVAMQRLNDPEIYHVEDLIPALHATSLTEARARKLIRKLSSTRLDPVGNPLLQVRMLELNEREHWLVLIVHRLISDCFSIDRVFDEILRLYLALVQGAQSPFTEDPVQYSRYVAWQKQSAGEWDRRHASYWRDRLSDARVLQWPTSPSRLDVEPNSLGKLRGCFGASVSESLRDLGKRTRTLAASVALSVYVAVLWRWCGQSDIVVPFNVTGRQTEYKSVVGYFSHILYLRMDLKGSETFAELVQSVSKEFYRALSHQDFGRVAADRPDLLAGTFFQWITHNPATTFTAGSLSARRIAAREFGDGFTAIPPGVVDVEMSLFDTGEDIIASGVYRADLFTAEQMERFMHYLAGSAAVFAADPTCRLASMPSIDDVPLSRGVRRA